MLKQFAYSILLLAGPIFSATDARVFAQQSSGVKGIVHYVCDPAQQNVKMYWQNNRKPIGSLGNLVSMLKQQGKNVVFAMNGGMYQKDQSPQGLYIENGRQLAVIKKDTSGYGNFYMQPNGIFYITKNHKAVVCRTQDFHNNRNIQYATQSGPMLISNGKMNSHFNEGSNSLFVRNGVGILPDGCILFAISDHEINFYDFASFFLDMGCENALYLDGFVSRMYLPEKKFVQHDGRFGVMIAVTE